MLCLPRSTLHLGPSLLIYECFHVSYFLDMSVQISKYLIYGVYLETKKMLLFLFWLLLQENVD